MNHESWTTLVGFISMGVSIVCAVVATGIAVWAIRNAFRDQREAQDQNQNRSNG